MTAAVTNKGNVNVYPLIILHLLLVLPLAWYLNIWADEASTLYSTDHGLINALQNAATVERQAPLYFWVMSVWRSISGSIFFARIFSVICTVVAIKLFAGFVSRVLPARSALLATAFFAMHPILIWAAVEIRVYALVIMLAIAPAGAILRGLFSRRFSPAADRFSRSRDRRSVHELLSGLSARRLLCRAFGNGAMAVCSRLSAVNAGCGRGFFADDVYLQIAIRGKHQRISRGAFVD